MLDTNLRPLSLGEILDRTFALYRQNFLLFFGITAVPYTLNLALSLFQVWYFGISSAKGVQAVSAMFTGTHLLFTLLTLIVGCLVYVFSEGGTILAVTQLSSRPPDVDVDRIERSFGTSSEPCSLWSF